MKTKNQKFLESNIGEYLFLLKIEKHLFNKKQKVSTNHKRKLQIRLC